MIGIPVSAAALLGAYAGVLLFRSSVLAALCSIFAQYSAFNLFHLDGLLDSADAMLPMASKERRLEILKDSRIGVYAFFAGFVALAARTAALARLFEAGSASDGGLLPTVLMASLIVAPVAGRGAAALVPLFSKPARSAGLGALMTDFSIVRVLAGFLLALLPFGLWAWASRDAVPGIAGVVIAFVSAMVSGLFISRLYTRKVGGFTGDTLGAAVELGELLAILIFVALASAPHGMR
jgi:adenosylcobinamide-GDP ribazoletransferase